MLLKYNQLPFPFYCGCDNQECFFLYSGNITDFDAVSLANFLPSSTSDYYRYYGSLTTPSCDEVVVWTVLNNKVSISSDQVGFS